MPVRSASGGLAPARRPRPGVASRGAISPGHRRRPGQLQDEHDQRHCSGLADCVGCTVSCAQPGGKCTFVDTALGTRPGSYLRGLSSGNSNKASWCIYLCGSRPRSTPPLWRRTLEHGKASGHGCSGAVAACTKCALLHAQLCLRRFVLWAARICWKKPLVLQLAKRQPAGATGALRMLTYRAGMRTYTQHTTQPDDQPDDATVAVVQCCRLNAN